MKKNTALLALILLLSIANIQYVLAQEVSQEPEPPQIPEPSPEPEPIKLPEPEPIPGPFPEESDSEKVQRLTKENKQLQDQNSKLQLQVANLQKQISEMDKSIKKLHEITLEQIKVIMDLVNRLRQVVFDMSLSSAVDI